MKPVVCLLSAFLVAGIWSDLDARQIPVWRSNVTLWSHAHALAPMKARPALNYGTALDAVGRYADAETLYEQAWELADGLPPAAKDAIDQPVMNNLGHLALVRGDVPTALEWFLKMSPQFGPGQVNRAIALDRLGRCDEANRVWERLQLLGEPCGS